MKKVILVIAMVFATSSIVNANTGEINIKTSEKLIMFDQCNGFANNVARDYANRGCDYWTVWFAAYGHCFDRTVVNK